MDNNVRNDIDAFCQRFGLTYKVHSDTIEMKFDGTENIRSGWVSFHNPNSKTPDRPLTFVSIEHHTHWTMCGFGGHPDYVKNRYRYMSYGTQTDDELISDALRDVLSGCRIKVSSKRNIDLPVANSVQELIFKMEIIEK